MQSQQDFAQKLGAMKRLIDEALVVHVKKLKKSTAQDFTPYSMVAVDAYTGVLERGGKRIRGALAMVGYQMCGGQDGEMILQAACAIEMVHAYILVLDDIMDKSAMRRGGPSAHTAIAQYHKSHTLTGDSQHFGEAVAINGALIGTHYAHTLIAVLDAPDKDKIKALGLLNEALVVTGHGQINDLFNEVLETVDERAVDQVLEWKTAHYTFLNPLQFGMALAGASAEALQAITSYCMYAGRAFQITDDILGTFGSAQEAGKSPMDDIREGKRTLLSVMALQRAQNGDKNFLIQMLGNDRLTQAEFTRCKEIFEATGALEYADTQATILIQKAKDSLHQHDQLWTHPGTDFLDSLVGHLRGRSS